MFGEMHARVIHNILFFSLIYQGFGATPLGL